ncbi:hypothetical protein ACFQ1R_11085 [Mariniflexile jejuense]|uniref:Lipoprotein n=1 Tax=Mariniflexile jejuense TaxID=1173582 RepID=A0ABW3JJI6_9FLAO
MKKFLPVFFISCLFLMAFQCEDDTIATQESEQEALNISKKAIEDLAATSICNENTTCKYIALGSKPCGGPWSYLVYSTSINVEKLENMVETYNKKESDFNKKWGAISDCMFVTPPTSIKCENNTCIVIY